MLQRPSRNSPSDNSSSLSSFNRRSTICSLVFAECGNPRDFNQLRIAATLMSAIAASICFAFSGMLVTERSLYKRDRNPQVKYIVTTGTTLSSVHDLTWLGGSGERRLAWGQFDGNLLKNPQDFLYVVSTIFAVQPVYPFFATIGSRHSQFPHSIGLCSQNTYPPMVRILFEKFFHSCTEFFLCFGITEIIC